MKARTSERPYGFTLIELLVVIAIIGILAGIVLVSVNNARQKGIAVRIQTEVAQMRSILEQDYANAQYEDIVGTLGHTANLSLTGTGTTSISLLACDVGKLLLYPDTVPNDLMVVCGAGLPEVHSGVVIYTTATTASTSDFGIYATSSPSGYVCYDSYGNVVSTTSASIPAYADIASPKTALCQ